MSFREQLLLSVAVIRRHEIRQYTNDGKVTYPEALAITLQQIKKYGTLHSDPLKNMALQLYSYNCGRIKSSMQLGKCHNGRNAPGKRCGSPSSSVRRAHNRRREFELALWHHDWIKISEMTERNRQKVSAIIHSLK